MWNNKDLANFDNEVGRNLDDGEQTTGFGENFEASLQNEIASGLSISKFIMSSAEREQNDKLREKTTTDPAYDKFKTTVASSKSILGYETKWDYAAMADYAIANGEDGFVPLVELEDARKLAVQQADKNQREVISQAGGTGYAGNFIGAMATQIIEPINYLAVIPGIGPASSLAVKVAAGVATGGVAAGVALPVVQDWKNENDVEYTDEQMYMDVGMSAAFGGALSAVGHGISALGARKREIMKAFTEDGVPRGRAMDELEALDSAIEVLKPLQKEMAGIDGMDGKPLKENMRRLDDTARTQLELNPVAKADEVATNSSETVKYEETVAPPVDKSPDVDTPDPAVVAHNEEVAKLETSIARTQERIDNMDFEDPRSMLMYDRMVENEVKLKQLKSKPAYDKSMNQFESTINCMMGGAK